MTQANSSIIYCADVIATLEGTELTVLIERLKAPLLGFALVGGKQDPGELLSETAVREFREETGLGLVITGVFRTYAGPDRDPRATAVTTVFTGTASGTVRDEPHKTRVVLASPDELDRYQARMIIDHGQILQDYRTHCQLVR
jgi:8-oxo-dGTP diphosphatase